jgi:hypothetical protein
VLLSQASFGMMDFKGQSHSKCPSACGMAMWKVATTKLITIERFFSSGFSQDFRTEISCFVPILQKIPVEWMNQNHKKSHKKPPP